MNHTASFVKFLTALTAAGTVAVTAMITPVAAVTPTDPPPSRIGPADVVEAPDGKYIVELVAPPIAAYTGGVNGIEATASRDGVSLDRTGPSVDAYAAHLDAERAAVLRATPGARVFYEYDWAFAGFAAEMSYADAQALAATTGVAGVYPNEMLRLDTEHSPEFLGISEPGGLWDQSGGPEEAGEGIVVGIIDTGFTPESGSFAPLAEPAPVPPGWEGTCQVGDEDDLGGGPIGDGETTGTQEAALDCDGDVYNNKVIGARYFVAGFGTPDPDEFLSPRDAGGHGSHTGSTSGGNFDVAITVGGAALGSINGMAPRARIAAYKVCWQTPAGGSCASADTTGAIDRAVADGVDVINYSISGSTSSAVTPQATAFRNAAAAGIFVAVSAGNSGVSGPSTVAHNYPWVTTVAASTQDREFRADAIMGNGDSYTGTSISTGVPETSAVYGGAIPDAGAPVDEARLCLPDSLDPDQVDGKIVVCERGVTARINKAQVVAALGGVGVVLANDVGNGTSTNTEYHVIPTVHVSFAKGQEIIDYVGRTDVEPDATIELTEYVKVVGTEITAPSMAAFSSLGPAQTAAGDILKPDITAPGVDILASLAPYATSQDQAYGFSSGTSMSSPHIAGIGALLAYLHPEWSPMAIKSAIMTGAYQENNQGDPIERLGVVADGFNYGAGHVDPQAASATPLVYETDEADWLAWLCGAGQLPPDNPLCAGGSIDPSDLNLASIAVNDVAGVRLIQRTVKNVSDATVTATVSFQNPDGFELSVKPAQIVVPAGGTAKYTLRIERTGAPLSQWRHGALTWDAGDIQMRSPVAVRAVSAETLEWELLDSGSTAGFRGLDAVSAEIAWASSDDGEVLRTVNGGVTFEDVSPPEGAEDELLFRDVEARNADEALVLAVGTGEASRVYRTVDGGETWDETFRGDDPAAFFDCMAMFDRRHGIVLGDPVDGKFQVLITSNAGRTWTYAPESGMPDALDGEFAFAASGTCATATGKKAFFGTGGGAEARVFRSLDFGLTWDVSSTPILSTESGGIFSLDFRTNKLGIAIGGDFALPEEATDALARSTDGGVTWELVDEAVAPTGYRSGLAWYADRRGDERAVPDPEQTVVIAVGPTGSDVSRDRGRTWEQFDDGAFNSIECALDHCWAVGPSGRIARLVGSP